MEALGVQF